MAASDARQRDRCLRPDTGLPTIAAKVGRRLVIYTSSGVGRQGRAFWGAYSVSKFATEGLSQVLADEHRHSNLRSNCVNPGATRTKMRLEAFPAEDRDALKRPEEILSTYIYLLGSDSKGVTGQSFNAQ